jgi:hypothetical protein
MIRATMAGSAINESAFEPSSKCSEFMSLRAQPGLRLGDTLHIYLIHLPFFILIFGSFLSPGQDEARGFGAASMNKRPNSADREKGEDEVASET